MKTHTTNYFDTFIEVAPDTKATAGTKPPSKGDKKSIAEMQYEMIAEHPYQYTSDDVLFQVFADRNDLTQSEYKAGREQFFSKGQACLRASPLTKTYGFGLHFNHEGKVAAFGLGTEAYDAFVNNDKLNKVKAMRSSKA